jgi:hypothetical protein
MQDRDFVFVNEHHRRLIEISRLEHTLREARSDRPTLKDYILLHSGEYLISLGQRLRSASIYKYEPPSDLTQECA